MKNLLQRNAYLQHNRCMITVIVYINHTFGKLVYMLIFLKETVVWKFDGRN